MPNPRKKNTMQLIALWALSYIQFSFQTTIATQPAHIISLNQSKYQENIENARKALEWYAWKDLRIDRRLLAESDTSEETLRLRRRLPEDEEDFEGDVMEGDSDEEGFAEGDYEEED